jgi:hydrogenase maturation protease
MSNAWNQPTTIVIGIGSTHGDDQFGWAVVDNLASMKLVGLKLLKVCNPVDIINELETHERVILVDACDDLPRSSPILKLNYSEAKDQGLVRETTKRSTHNFGLEMSLRLAKSLGRPTDHVTLWIGRGESFSMISEMGSTTAKVAVDCAQLITEELCDARNVTC